MPRSDEVWKPLRVTLLARAAEAEGEPFLPMGTSLSDAGVALDEILSLTSNIEPVVLRVIASGGSELDRDAVGGDWLCADHEQPRRIHRPAAAIGDLPMWTSEKEPLDAWEGCQDASWLLSSAAAVGVRRELVARGAAACVAEAARVMPEGRAASVVSGAIASVAAWAERRSGAQGVSEAAALLVGDCGRRIGDIPSGWVFVAARAACLFVADGDPDSASSAASAAARAISSAAGARGLRSVGLPRLARRSVTTAALLRAIAARGRGAGSTRATPPH